MAAEFELWLEDVNDYLAICEVTDQEEKKRLFMNLAWLDLRRMVKRLVVPAPPNQEDGNPGDSYWALAHAVLAHFRPIVNTTSERYKIRQLKQ